MNGSCLPMMWPQAKRSVLVVVSILAWSCSLADHAHDCTKGSDDEADLCWARQAEAQLDDDPASAMETAERIADLRLHDITMLMIQRKLKDPRARVDSCKKLRDERAQQRCMTYEVRPHLWTKLTEQSEADPAEATPERVNSPSCVKLPVEWRDACELEGVLSRAMSSAGESFSGDLDDTRCLSIRDLSVRSQCRMEVATGLSLENGLDAGVAACLKMDNEVFRSECLLRVRATHPEAPFPRQWEICSLAGNLRGPCQSMITISSAAHLLKQHRGKPLRQALTDLDRDVVASADLLLELADPQQAGRYYREIWYRMFYRMVYDKHRAEETPPIHFVHLVAILSILEPSDQRYQLFRANLLHYYATQRCLPGKRSKASVDVSPSQELCVNPANLVALFVSDVHRARSSASLGRALDSPMYLSDMDPSDWWSIYKSDVGALPSTLAQNCEMSTSEFDEFIATVALTRGDWVYAANAFRLALHSEYLTVRSFTVTRLIKRLFVEWPYLPEREVTAASLKTWKHEYSEPLQMVLQHILDSVENDVLVPQSKEDHQHLHAAEMRVREKIRNDASLFRVYGETGGSPLPACSEPSWPASKLGGSVEQDVEHHEQAR